MIQNAGMAEAGIGARLRATLTVDDAEHPLVIRNHRP